MLNKLIAFEERLLAELVSPDGFLLPAALEVLVRHNIRMPPETRSRLVRDTLNFPEIRQGDLLQLGESVYYVTGDALEMRFGLEGEPKPWVKIAIDLQRGKWVVIKLVFHETMAAKFGDLELPGERSAKKEAAFLSAVRGNPSFMQGFSLMSEQGEPVRIIDYIDGPTLDSLVLQGPESHREYFESRFLSLARKFSNAARALHEVHRNGLHHGDIRRDHLLLDRPNDKLVWIDFDVAYSPLEVAVQRDIFGLGNTFLFVVGKGFQTRRYVQECRREYPDATSFEFDEADLISELPTGWGRRIVNLKKLYPYLPDPLHQLLMRFATVRGHGFRSTAELADAIEAALA